MKHSSRYLPSLMAAMLLATLLTALSCGGSKIEPDNRPKDRSDFTNPPLETNPLVDFTKWEIRDGRFYLDGKWTFLKIAKPLVNYASESSCRQIMDNLDIYRSKYYNAIEMNCYWHFFDDDGDGTIDHSLEPLRALVDAIYAKGMFPCIGVETYSVGGGRIPDPFWETNPDAYAIDSNGHATSDTEYGFGTKVVSIFHEGYREASHRFIANLARGLDTKKVLWFETTVEPQYMGEYNLCYSDAAKRAYAEWRTANGISDAASKMPEGFPIPQEFIENETWNKFRAQSLADWVNGDAAAWRSVAGEKAYVAVDFLDANLLRNRCGDPVEFLRHLECADVLQVNWHWRSEQAAPHNPPYEHIAQVKAETGKSWAVSEHMTIGGTSITAYGHIPQLLEHTLKVGTRLGWEFTNVRNTSNDKFALYKDDWNPKYPMKDIDENWGYWLWRIGQDAD
ncbi:MAG: hypothetical protein IJS70_04925 [Bacteroidales bacterium]|nr:hypothetical protein [Bacteroidales bacterium]